MKKINLFACILVVILTGGNLHAQDTLKFEVLNRGVKPSGDFSFYKSKDGFVYKVGEKVRIGVPSSNKTFAYIISGDGMLTAVEQLNSSASGTETEIKKIYIDGNKRNGFAAVFKTKGRIGGINTPFVIKVEIAIETGEMVTSGISSDAALTELKKAKDKLDLGLITQEEYDKKKAELSKYIK
jgi:hypothetical protein